MEVTLRTIHDLTFDTEVRHRKGLATEDATIKIAGEWARKVGATLRPRIVPRLSGQGFGELDAAIFCDFGIVVLEAKRWAGTITRRGGQVSVSSRNGTKTHEDPAVRLSRVGERLSRAIESDPRWRGYVSAWQHTSARKPVVVGLLVFGPTTDGFDGLTAKSVHATSTRRLARALDALRSAHPWIVGTGSLAANAASVWAQQGKLVVRGVTGFARVHLAPWTLPFGENRWLSLIGLREIQCAGKGRIEVRPFSPTRVQRGDTEGIVLEGWVGGRAQNIWLPTDRRFTWRALDR